MAAKAKKIKKNLKLKRDKLARVDEEAEKTFSSMTNISDRLKALAEFFAAENRSHHCVGCEDGCEECLDVKHTITKARECARKHSGIYKLVGIDE